MPNKIKHVLYLFLFLLSCNDLQISNIFFFPLGKTFSFFHFYKNPFSGKAYEKLSHLVFYTHLCILNIKILIHNDILLHLASLIMSASLSSVLDCFLFLAIIFYYDIYLVKLASGFYFWALQNLYFFLFN